MHPTYSPASTLWLVWPLTSTIPDPASIHCLSSPSPLLQNPLSAHHPASAYKPRSHSSLVYTLTSLFFLPSLSLPDKIIPGNSPNVPGTPRGTRRNHWTCPCLISHHPKLFHFSSLFIPPASSQILLSMEDQAIYFIKKTEAIGKTTQAPNTLTHLAVSVSLLPCLLPSLYKWLVLTPGYGKSTLS